MYTPKEVLDGPVICGTDQSSRFITCARTSMDDPFILISTRISCACEHTGLFVLCLGIRKQSKQARLCLSSFVREVIRSCGGPLLGLKSFDFIMYVVAQLISFPFSGLLIFTEAKLSTVELTTMLKLMGET